VLKQPRKDLAGTLCAGLGAMNMCQHVVGVVFLPDRGMLVVLQYERCQIYTRSNVVAAHS
jgi:hypothetical protein